MKSGADPWQQLGLAPTSDIRQIRKAYARALKAFDVDADPNRFIQLRAALEAALSEAPLRADAACELIPADATGPSDDDRWHDQPEVGSDPDHGTGHPVDALAETAPAAQLDRSGPWDSPSPEQVNAHAAALAQLLLENDAARASDDETDAMISHWRAICSDPRMEEISHYGACEAWISDLLARACPRSDPLLDPVSAYFRWNRAADEVSDIPAVSFLKKRIAGLNFLAAIQLKSHPLNRAWRELTTPATVESRRGFWVSRRSVTKLLAIVRNDYPGIESCFDWCRVGLWENPRPAYFSWGTIAIGAWLILQVGIHVFQLNDTTSTPPAAVAAESDALDDSRSDIDRALQSVSRNTLGIEEVERRNPALLADLEQLWRNDQAIGKNQWDLAADMGDMLDDRFERVMSKASYGTVAALTRVRLDAARFFRNRGAAYCDNFFQGKSTAPVLIPRDLDDQWRGLYFEILMEAGPDTKRTPSDRSFTLSDDLVTKIAKRADLSPEAFMAAMRGKGTPDQRCAARIALRETVLAMPPREGMAYLAKI